MLIVFRSTRCAKSIDDKIFSNDRIDLQLDSVDFGDFGEIENMGFEKKKCSVSSPSFIVDFLKKNQNSQNSTYA